MTLREFFPKFIAAALCLLCCCVTTSVRATEGSLDSVLEKMVAAVSDYLRAEGHATLTISGFDGPPQLGATAGPGIVKKLTTMFERPEHGIKIVPLGAKISLNGRYYMQRAEAEAGSLTVVLEGRLEDSFGGVIQNFTLDDAIQAGGLKAEGGKIEGAVRKEEDVVQLLGVTAKLDPRDQNPEDRNKDLLKSVKNSQDPQAPANFSIDATGFQVSAKDSPYAVEIVVGSTVSDDQLKDGRPRRIEALGKFPFISINRDEIYAIRLHNHSEFDAAVELKIDGLSVFDFSEIKKDDGTPKYKFYFVPAKSSITVHGWHINHTKQASFLVTKYADSAAAKQNRQGSLGTITALFCASWEDDAKMPPDEPTDLPRGEGDATGFGPNLRQATREVERSIGVLRSTVSLRYTKPNES